MTVARRHRGLPYSEDCPAQKSVSFRTLKNNRYDSKVFLYVQIFALVFHNIVAQGEVGRLFNG
jgi:hypothetical protein